MTFKPSSLEISFGYSPVWLRRTRERDAGRASAVRPLSGSRFGFEPGSAVARHLVPGGFTARGTADFQSGPGIRACGPRFAGSRLRRAPVPIVLCDGRIVLEPEV